MGSIYPILYQTCIGSRILKQVQKLVSSWNKRQDNGCLNILKLSMLFTFTNVSVHFLKKQKLEEVCIHQLILHITKQVRTELVSSWNIIDKIKPGIISTSYQRPFAQMSLSISLRNKSWKKFFRGSQIIQQVQKS